MSANRMNDHKDTHRRLGGRVARIAATLVCLTTISTAIAIASIPGTSSATTVGTPNAPTAVSAARGSSRSLFTVQWMAPTSNGGSAITGYIVTPFHNGIAQAALQFKNTATTETFGLPGGILGCWSYVFRVAATNKSGTGPQSASSNYVSWPCRY